MYILLSDNCIFAYYFIYDVFIYESSLFAEYSAAFNPAAPSSKVFHSLLHLHCVLKIFCLLNFSRNSTQLLPSLKYRFLSRLNHLRLPKDLHAGILYLPNLLFSLTNNITTTLQIPVSHLPTTPTKVICSVLV